MTHEYVRIGNVIIQRNRVTGAISTFTYGDEKMAELIMGVLLTCK